MSRIISIVMYLKNNTRHDESVGMLIEKYMALHAEPAENDAPESSTNAFLGFT